MSFIPRFCASTLVLVVRYYSHCLLLLALALSAAVFRIVRLVVFSVPGRENSDARRVSAV